MKLLFFAVFLPLTLTSCLGSTNNSKNIVKTTEVVENFIKNGWDFEVPFTAEALKEMFGKPVSPITEKVSTLDESITVLNAWFKEVQITLYKYPDGKVFVKNLKVQSPDFKIKMSLHVGTDKKRIIARLGKPNIETKDTLTYSSSDAPALVFIYMNGDRVKSYSFYPIGKEMMTLLESAEKK